MKQVELEITDLAFDGKAVALLDGKVVFLDSGLPGEKVLAEITQSKPRYNRARLCEVITPSPDRIAARCSHFESCGGCTWQDLSYHKQLEYKKKQVADCLERIGGLKNVTIRDTIGSAEQFFYRNKMEFSFHTTDDGGFTLGLHRRGAFDDIFDLDRCYLLSEISNEMVRWVRDFVIRHRIPVYDVIGHTGYMRFLMIRQGKRTGQIMVNLVTNYGEFPHQGELIAGLRESFPKLTTVVHNQTGRKSNIATGEIEQILYGPGYIEERILTRTFRIRANSFFQTNSLQAETLYRTACEMLEPAPGHRVLDLYCGTGPIGILVAEHVTEVVGVELVGDAVKLAEENAVLNGVDNISFLEANVTEYLKTCSAERRYFDIVVVDPPRAGLHPKALKRIMTLKPEKILYISCNPATFARDAAKLVEEGYHLPSLTPVDMFPHTKHIETVAVLHRL
jgi:23S rRNA (uracil1939-C5)-methyltransferase